MDKVRYVRFVALVAVLFATRLSIAADSELLNFERGPYEVGIVESLTLNDSVQNRDVPLRLLYPEAEGPFPLVVFSTGAFCFPQLYDLITSHWVSHGYVVVEPNHLDSPNNASKPTPDQYPDFFPSRVRDISFVVDDIDAITAAANIPGRVDSQRVAAAGHSFGAIISMVKTGLILKDEFADTWPSTSDDRFQAAVLLSAPGPGMDELTADAYSGLHLPLIATGGTNDVGRVDPGDYSPAEWRTLAFTLSPEGDKYSVITEGSDHYMGGLICNSTRGGDPDPESVAIVAAMTTTFLDAYLKDDEQAMGFLKTADVSAITDGQARSKHK